MSTSLAELICSFSGYICMWVWAYIMGCQIGFVVPQIHQGLGGIQVSSWSNSQTSWVEFRSNICLRNYFCLRPLLVPAREHLWDAVSIPALPWKGTSPLPNLEELQKTFPGRNECGWVDRVTWEPPCWLCGKKPSLPSKTAFRGKEGNSVAASLRGA